MYDNYSVGGHYCWLYATINKDGNITSLTKLSAGLD